jgi:hypothetical protein
MALLICFVDPSADPPFVLKVDDRCTVTDDGSVVLTEGRDTIRFGTLDAFFPFPSAKREWTFCTKDERVAKAVHRALEIGRSVGSMSVRTDAG